MKLNFKQRSSLIAIIILWLVTGLLLTYITDIVYVGFMEDITAVENLPKKTALQSQAAQYLRNKLPRTQ